MTFLNKKDGYAFPVEPYTNGIDPGMTLRDYFAGAALPQCLAAPTSSDELKFFFGQRAGKASNAEVAAARAYMVADAMLAERKREPRA